MILIIDFRFTEASEKIKSDYKYFLKSFANFCTQFEWMFVTALEYELEFCEIYRSVRNEFLNWLYEDAEYF